MAAIPIVDFAPFLAADSTDAERKQVALDIDKACREIGFFYLKNHGVPAELIANMLGEARGFFETASEDDKKAIAIKGPSGGGDNSRGYLKVTNAEKGSHEAVDFFRPVDGRSPPYTTGMGPNKWPERYPELKSVASTYIEHLEALGQQVIKAIAIGLNIDEHVLLDRTDKSFWNLRILGYEGRKTKMSNAAGIGQHTDFGILTFLLTDPCKQSLQVLNKNKEWIWADPIEGAFICNIGDMLSEWTRGAYQSTLHRVCHSSDTLRISVPFFFEPNWDAFISPVVPVENGKEEEQRGIFYKDKFIQSMDYPLWRESAEAAAA